VTRVNPAAQVLEKFGSPESSGTATLCEMEDSHFDCLNVRSTKEHQRKRKPFLAPHTAVDNKRLNWMETTFSLYYDLI